MSVTGNVEVLVMPMSQGESVLSVADVPTTARGGAVIVSADSDQTYSLTDELRAGQQQFDFNLSSINAIINPASSTTASVTSTSGNSSTFTTADNGSSQSGGGSSTAPPAPAPGSSAGAETTAEQPLYGYLTDDDAQQAGDANHRKKHNNGDNQIPGNRKEPASQPSPTPNKHGGEHARNVDPQHTPTIVLAAAAALKSPIESPTQSAIGSPAPASGQIVPAYIVPAHHAKAAVAQAGRHLSIFAGVLLAGVAALNEWGNKASARADKRSDR